MSLGEFPAITPGQRSWLRVEPGRQVEEREQRLCVEMLLESAIDLLIGARGDERHVLACQALGSGVCDAAVVVPVVAGGSVLPESSRNGG